MLLKTLLLSTVAIAAALSQVSAAPGDFMTGTVGMTAGANNWPAGEAPSFALDGNAGTKYLNFAEEFTGFAVTLTTASAVNSISFNSANDAPERSPATFSLFGSNSVTITGSEPANTVIFNLSSFTSIVENQATGFTTSTPFLTNSIQSFTNATAYKTYLLVFPTLTNAGAANSMQIGDAILRSNGAAVVTNTTPVAGGELTPVPEPSSVALLSASIGLLALRRRR